MCYAVMLMACDRVTTAENCILFV